MVERELKNPFKGYEKDLLVVKQAKDINPIHEIVNAYYQMKGVADKPSMFYNRRWSYGKLAKEAKELYIACGNSLDDAMWALDQMKHKAEKGNFDWSISTCLKHKLTW